MRYFYDRCGNLVQDSGLGATGGFTSKRCAQSVHDICSVLWGDVGGGAYEQCIRKGYSKCDDILKAIDNNQVYKRSFSSAVTTPVASSISATLSGWVRSRR